MSAAGPPAGLAALRRRLAALPATVRAAAHGALQRIGADVLEEARRALRPDTAGPSAPGEAPHDPSGALAASLMASLDPVTDRLTIGAASPHAIFLEYGTRRMGARPFLRPAVEATRASALACCRAATAAAALSAKETP